MTATASPTVDIDEAQRLARALPERERSLRPRHEWSRWVGAVTGGLVFGFAIVPVANLALSPAFVADLTRDASSSRSFVAQAVSAFAFAVAGVLLAWFRQKPVEVVIDHDGITEKEGGEGRIHIRWREARAFAEERHFRNRYGQRFVGHEVRIAGPSGAMIVLTTADNSFFWPDRPTRTVVPYLMPSLVEIARLLPPLDPKTVDPRIVEERGTRLERILAFVGTALAIFPIYMMLDHCVWSYGGCWGGTSLRDAMSMSAVLFVGGALRVFGPLRRFRRHRRGRVRLAIRLATLVLLVAYPFVMRKSMNEKCLQRVEWGKEDRCRQ